MSDPLLWLEANGRSYKPALTAVLIGLATGGSLLSFPPVARDEAPFSAALVASGISVSLALTQTIRSQLDEVPLFPTRH
jgi:hypothetical protein